MEQVECLHCHTSWSAGYLIINYINRWKEDLIRHSNNMNTVRGIYLYTLCPKCEDWWLDLNYEQAGVIAKRELEAATCSPNLYVDGAF